MFYISVTLAVIVLVFLCFAIAYSIHTIREKIRGTFLDMILSIFGYD